MPSASCVLRPEQITIAPHGEQSVVRCRRTRRTLILGAKETRLVERCSAPCHIDDLKSAVQEDFSGRDVEKIVVLLRDLGVLRGNDERTARQRPWSFRIVTIPLSGIMCALPFLITLPVWTAPMTLGYWGLCALLTLALPRTNRSAIVAIVAIVYAALNFAITLRFNAALLRVTHLPLIIAVARTVVDFVIMSCLAAMIFVVFAAAVQGIENAVRRLTRSAHPGQEVSA